MTLKSLIRGARHNLRQILHVSYIQVRAASAGKRPVELFNASRLLLDLDATDSGFIRRYVDAEESPVHDPADSKGPSRVRTRNPVRRIRTSTQDQSRSPSTTAILHPRPAQSLAPDYLATALLGPRSEPSFEADQHRRCMTHHIHNHNVPFYESLVWMQNDAAAFSIYNREALSHSEGVLKALKTISAARSKSKLEHAVAAITGSREGCEALAINPRVINEAIRSVGMCENVPHLWTLQFLSNLVTKLHAKIQKSSTMLSDLCLLYAAKARSLPALYRYVEIATSQHDSDGALRLAAISTTFSWTSDRNEPDPISRKDILRLATGWDSGGVPNGTEKRQTSLAKLVKTDSALHNCYLRGLGSLGAVEALWYEWTHPKTVHTARTESQRNMSITDVSGRYNVPVTAATRPRRMDVFVDAFLEAGDYRRAQQVLAVRVELKEHTNSGSRKFQIPGDKDDDDERNDALQVMLLEHYIRHGTKAISGQRLRAVAKRIQSEHNMPRGTLSALECVLGVETSSGRSQDILTLDG